MLVQGMNAGKDGEGSFSLPLDLQHRQAENAKCQGIFISGFQGLESRAARLEALQELPEGVEGKMRPVNSRCTQDRHALGMARVGCPQLSVTFSGIF